MAADEAKLPPLLAGARACAARLGTPASLRKMPSFSLAIEVFGVIFLAELPDKTALAALVLATKYKPAPVFAGTALALTVQSAIAVLAGSLLSLLPSRAVHIGTGVVFLISALVMWIREEP